MQKKIVLIGGPGAGKTTVLNELNNRGFYCKIEISREVTLKAQKEGIDQLFLTEPLLFSEKLLEGRAQQYLDAEKSGKEIAFFDRGIPDVHAYMNYFNTNYPSSFLDKSKHFKYDKIFLFPPWKAIYTPDNERYETFEESTKINDFLEVAYQEIGYHLIKVPFGTVVERANFILNAIEADL